MSRSTPSRNWALLLAAVVVGAGGLAGSGCVVGAFIGGMAESYRRSSTYAVAAEYDGLEGKSFAVAVYGDRVLQGSQPTLLPRLTNRITLELAQPARTGVSGFVPPQAVLELQFANPDWAGWSYERLAEEFGVDRLIVVEIYEYRLNEPGNAYLWDGLIAAKVGVVEADGPIPGEFSFSKDIQVRFPNETGMGPSDFTRSQVQAGVEQRFVHRVTWLFFEHQEAYYPEY